MINRDLRHRVRGFIEPEMGHLHTVRGTRGQKASQASTKDMLQEYGWVHDHDEIKRRKDWEV